MVDDIQVGDRVKVFLDSSFWKSEGWFKGTVVRIDPYSGHRSFYWVELDTDVQSAARGPDGPDLGVEPGEDREGLGWRQSPSAAGRSCS